MPDHIIREKELQLIYDFIAATGRKSLNILDAGCGNGFAVDYLKKKLPDNLYTGLDFTPELIDIAKDRELPDCGFMQGDIKDTKFSASSFDFIYSERCLINILDWEGQKEALTEIARILRPGGYYLMLECFTDGQENYNRARDELGLKEIPPAYHNLYFEKEKLFKFVKSAFDVVEPYMIFPEADLVFPQNFLSSHYFVSRVLYPAITKKDWLRNSELTKFFSFLEPHGNYSPLQAIILQRHGK